MLPPSCTYTEQPEEFSFLHTCDLASISIFLFGPVPELLASGYLATLLTHLNNYILYISLFAKLF